MAASRPRPRAPACCAECPNRGARRRGDPKISEARDRIRSIRPDRGARRRPEVRFPFWTAVRNRARRFGGETAAPLPFGAPLAHPRICLVVFGAQMPLEGLFLIGFRHWKAYFDCAPRASRACRRGAHATREQREPGPDAGGDDFSAPLKSLRAPLCVRRRLGWPAVRVGVAARPAATRTRTRAGGTRR